MTSSNTLAHGVHSERELLREVKSAFALLQTMREIDSATMVVNADRRLRAAIDAASDSGVKWGPIAKEMGMARGNAYQRYRRRRCIAPNMDTQPA